MALLFRINIDKSLSRGLRGERKGNPLSLRFMWQFIFFIISFPLQIGGCYVSSFFSVSGLHMSNGGSRCSDMAWIWNTLAWIMRNEYLFLNLVYY